MQAQTYEIERTSGRCAKTHRQLEPGEKYMAALVDAAEYSPNDIQSMTGKGKSMKKGEQLKPASRSADGVGLWRIDISLEAWEAGFRPQGLFSFWQAEVAHPNQKRKMFVNNEVMMDIIRGLEDTADQNRLAFRFVVALILFRKKLLRYERTEQHPVPVAPEVKQELSEGESMPAEAEAIQEETEPAALANWWVFTPKLDINKGPMSKWHPDETLMVMDPDLNESGIEAITEQLSDILASELD